MREAFVSQAPDLRPPWPPVAVFLVVHMRKQADACLSCFKR